jgi:hypothetical protein
VLAALAARGWQPPTEALLSAVADVAAWALPQLVWASGRALGAFLRAAGIASSFDYDVESALAASAFVPHPSVAIARICIGGVPAGQWPADSADEAAQRAHALHRDTCDAPTMALRAPNGAVLTWPGVAAWVGVRIVADIERIRAQHKGDAYARSLRLRALAPLVMSEMGTSLLARLQAVVMQRCAKPLRGDVVDTFSSREYERLESWAAQDRRRLEAFFHALMAGLPVRVEQRHRLRADGRLTFSVAGEHALCWKDFGMRRGGDRGRGLGSLVMYHMGDASPAAAMQWLRRWAEEYMRCEETGAPAVAHSPRRKEPAVRARDASTAGVSVVAGVLRYMTRAAEGTVASRYLRGARGLGDESNAPLALIEQNPAIWAHRARQFEYTDKATRTVCSCSLPVVAFVSRSQSCVQLVYLESVGAVKTTRDNAKRTRGEVVDAVAIRAPAGEHVPRVFLAEGPETALSVACAFPDDAVFAALGVGNYAKFSCPEAAAVVICRENDARAGVHIAASVAAARRVLASRFASVSEMWPPPGYGDFNDVHQRHPGAEGSMLIRACLGASGNVMQLDDD